MSTVACDGCAAIITDYDEDPMMYTDAEDQTFCERCQAAHMADGWVLAQEFGAEMRYNAAVDAFTRMIDAADMARKQSKGE